MLHTVGLIIIMELYNIILVSQAVRESERAGPSLTRWINFAGIRYAEYRRTTVT